MVLGYLQAEEENNTTCSFPEVWRRHFPQESSGLSVCVSVHARSGEHAAVLVRPSCAARCAAAGGTGERSSFFSAGSADLNDAESFLDIF